MKPLLTAAVLGCGCILGTVLPQPVSWFAFWGCMAGGYLLFRAKARKILVSIGPLKWTKEDLCRHVLITGDTGSGKTTSGLQPILVQLSRTAPDWGGLVLGVKGDEHRFISELADASGRIADVIHLQVRPEEQSTKWAPPHRYNLVSDRSIPWMTHAKAIVDIASSMTEGTQHAFFRPMAQIALANAFRLLDELGLPVTLTRAYDVLTCHAVAEEYVKPLRRNSASDEQRRLAAFFDSTLTHARAYEQREAIEGTIKTYLGFALDPDVASVFSSDEPNTCSFSQLDHGSIITVTMPQRLVTERRYIQTYLKILFYYHVLRRFDRAPAERQNENLLLLVADEFQDIVTASEDGISDHKVIDRIRGAGAAIIAGMQSEISADPAAGIAKRKVLSLNMRSRLIFRAADQDGAAISADFIGKRKVWKKTKTSKCFGPVTYSHREAEEHYVKPSQLMRLKDHTAVVAHPSKKYTRKKIVPVDGRGKRYLWY